MRRADKYAEALARLDRLRDSGQVDDKTYELHKVRLQHEARFPWAKWAKFVGIVGGAVLVISASGWMTSPHPQSATPATVFTPEPAPTVVYEVTGSATSADITIETPDGTSQQRGVDVPLKSKAGTNGLAFTGFSSGDFLYISALNGDEYGAVTCRIKVNGEVVAENTGSGGYAIASCKATV